MQPRVCTPPGQHRSRLVQTRRMRSTCIIHAIAHHLDWNFDKASPLPAIQRQHCTTLQPDKAWQRLPAAMRRGWAPAQMAAACGLATWLWPLWNTSSQPPALPPSGAPLLATSLTPEHVRHSIRYQVACDSYCLMQNPASPICVLCGILMVCRCHRLQGRPQEHCIWVC